MLRSEIVSKIRQSRYLAARAVNREILGLYFSIGEAISKRILQHPWGTGIISRLSHDIQADFPGIRGFSERNLKNMRRFYEHYYSTVFGQLLTAQTGRFSNGQLLTAQLTVSDDPLPEEFLSVSFTSHIVLLQKCKTKRERSFYLKQAAQNQWSVELLENHIGSKLYAHQGKIQNNFAERMPKKIRTDAIRAFRDEYLFPFVQVDDPNDEYLVERAIVADVKKFMLSLGREFTFMGNQYRLVIDEMEYFVDLLFYHRRLRSMIAIELKTGRFKPEFAGKMNFYLAALDTTIKLPEENPSIGIILCREKKKTTVEFAFKFTSAPMGVATYKFAENPPKDLARFLPDPAALKKAIAKSENER